MSSADEDTASDNDGWIQLMGDDLVMKVISTGTEDASPEAKDQAEVGDGVIIDFTGHQLPSFDGDGTTTKGLPFIEKQGCLIALGDGDVVPGLEMATRFLRSGDKAIVKCRSKYAYGAGGRRADSSSKSNLKDLPPNSDVVFTVCIREIIPTRQLLQSDDIKLQLASSKKQIGNEIYQYEWDKHGLGKARALKLYGKARDSMIELIGEIENRNDGDSASSDTNNTTKQSAIVILVDCSNNISAVHLKAKSYGLAKDSAATVLQYDPNNIKALCRAARAAIFDPAGTFEECEAAVACAEEIDAENADVKRLRVDLDRRKRQHKKREKAMYSKMMVGGSSSVESKQGALEGSAEDHKDIPATTSANNGIPPEYLYLFASFLITLGTLILFLLVSSTKSDQAGIDSHEL